MGCKERDNAKDEDGAGTMSAMIPLTNNEFYLDDKKIYWNNISVNYTEFGEAATVEINGIFGDGSYLDDVFYIKKIDNNRIDLMYR